jgi:hypothetical protein
MRDKLNLIYLKNNFWRFEYTQSYVEIPNSMSFREKDNSLWIASDEAASIIQFFSEEGL